MDIQINQQMNIMHKKSPQTMKEMLEIEIRSGGSLKRVTNETNLEMHLKKYRNFVDIERM